MATDLIINATLPETRIALLENNEIQELLIERDSERGIVGNIYKGKVIRVLPGMQAAFVDIGLEKAAFLYVDDIYFPDMQTPLKTNPLPEGEVRKIVLPPNLASAPVVVGEAREGREPVLVRPREDRERGRGGRDRDRGRGGRVGRDRDRGARGGRFGRKETRPGPAPLPGTPEDHDRLQREYAKQMLDLDESDFDTGHQPLTGRQKMKYEGLPQDVEEYEREQQLLQQQAQQSQDTSQPEAPVQAQAEQLDQAEQRNEEPAPAIEDQVAEPQAADTQGSDTDDGDSGPIAAGSDPRDRKPEDQPEARSPRPEDESAEDEQQAAAQETAPEQQGEEFADEDFDDEEDLDGEAADAVIYRPEPLIDADAWAEDVARAHRTPEPIVERGEPGDEAAPPVEVTGAQELAPEAASQEQTPIESSEAAPESETAAAEGAEPSVEVAEPLSPAEAGRKLVTPLVKPIVRTAPDHNHDHGHDHDHHHDEDEDEDSPLSMPRRRRRREPVNIADLVKEGQEILVQVAKDPIGTKGARLTCHISLPGRYLVFMPTVDHIGVSRRIESEGERRRLKDTMARVRPGKTGVIVRTASGKQTDKNLKSDLDYLVTTWNEIQKKFNKQRTPSMVYQDLTIVLRAIRDMFTDEVDRVVVDSKREHRAIMKFVSRFIPNVKTKVELYQGDMPIFDAFGIETEIQRSLERKVWLKSGGYLVIDQAEALVAIDVNTGRYVGKKTLEETILKTNLEAVKEIAYQLRLRNAGGIIILDLIDMEKESNREKVYKALEEALRKDRARPTILKISQLGLVEMTRKRTRDSMVRSLCEPCSYCEGKGYVKNKLTIAYDVMRDMEREGAEGETNSISVQCHPNVADVLLEDKRDVLEALEHRFNKKIAIRGNGAYHVEQYELVAQRGEKNIVWTSEERRQLVRQKIQERQQKIAAEQRKLDQADRDQKRREQKEQQAERRKQAQERREEQRRLQKEQAAQRRAAREQAAAAATDEFVEGEDSQNLDAGLENAGMDDSLENPGEATANLSEGAPTGDVVAEGAPQGQTEDVGQGFDAGSAMDDELDPDAGEGESAQEGRNGKRRRGRRGRGRDRFGGRHEVYIPAIHGAPTGPVPNVKPVVRDENGNPIRQTPAPVAVAPEAGEAAYAEPGQAASEQLEAQELSGALPESESSLGVEPAEGLSESYDDREDRGEGVEFAEASPEEDEGLDEDRQDQDADTDSDSDSDSDSYDDEEDAGDDSEDVQIAQGEELDAPEGAPREEGSGPARPQPQDDRKRRRGRRGGRFRYRKRPEGAQRAAGGTGTGSGSRQSAGSSQRQGRPQRPSSGGKGRSSANARGPRPVSSVRPKRSADDDSRGNRRYDNDDDSRGNRVDYGSSSSQTPSTGYRTRGNDDDEA